MLNINQNFDLKAPVFNFDRDYFNSVEELNAYDTSNVPDHFVTNVAGMLYQFTDGKWVPILSTEPSDEDDQWTLYLGKRGESSCHINGDSTGADCFVAEYSSNQSVIDSMHTSIQNSDDNKLISLSINEAYGIDESDGDSTVNMYLIDSDYRTDLNAKNGFKHKTDDGFVTKLDGYGLKTEDDTGRNLSTSNTSIRLNDAKYQTQIHIHSDADNNYLSIGSDEKFKLSRPTNDEGGIISGIKSLTAFANPSATKVWATDGTTVDLTTKANTSDLDAKANKSDVLLKKSTTGGYYVEENGNALGEKAFAANNTCTASGYHSFAEGFNSKALSQSAHVEGESNTASGARSHAEGLNTTANAICAHSEGYSTKAIGYYAHTEGCNTIASGYSAHAQGVYNVINENSIHSVGIGDATTRKNAEYIYAKNNTNGTAIVDDPKNGYKYLIGVGGYDGISTDNTTYKSVQEVIADLTARIEQLETKVKALEDANTPA